MWTVVVAILVVIIALSIKASIRPSNFPPGPPCFAVAGSLPYLDVRNLTNSFKKLSEKYGDIFSIFIGRTPVVVLNSYELIKEAFSKTEFAGRPGNFSGTFFQKGKTGITTTEGKHWTVQRQFLASHLLSLTSGQGYKGFEEVIMDEVSDLKMELGKRKNEPVAVSYKVHVAIMNILWNLACGRKLHAQQQEFQTVVECIDKVTQFMSRAAIFSFMPILTKILPESITNIERGRYYRNRFHEISEKWIREHRQEYRGNRTGDLQDAYLEKVNRGEDTFTEQGLSAILRELFVIGSESESVMMRWAIRILSCNVVIQRKVQAELERVCGPGMDVTWDKKDELPYTMAVMKEIQRFADIAPTGLLHKTGCETQISGYSLPANTLVLANLAACHRNPKFWPEPDVCKFILIILHYLIFPAVDNPENFLDDGKLVTDKEGFLPYGIGPRVCPGAELADMQLFLMMSNLLTVYTMTLPEGDEGEIGTQFEAGTSVLRNPKVW